MKSEERAVCSDCIDDHQSDDEVFVPVYYSAWKQRVPTGNTGITSNSSDSSGETCSDDADSDHILTADEIASFLALHSSSTQSLVYEQSLQDDINPKIRILWVEPAAFDEPIQCHLETVTLATAPYFEALSYCWGPTEPEAYIHVNGCKIRVTPNLKLALRRLRRSNAARPFWIDAICINQNDIPEKSSQVQRMRDIYVKAESTTVWLGEREDNSRLALDMCTRIFAAHGAHHMQESYLIDVKKEYQDWRTKRDLGVSEDPEDEDVTAFAEQFDLESLSLHAGYKLGYDAAFDETRRDLTLKSMADSIKEEEAKYGPTGIDQSDPQRYSQLLGQMMAQSRAQGLEWKGPFQQLYREIMEEDESTTEDAAAPTEQTESESMEETQAHVEPAVGKSNEEGATTAVARSPYAKAVQLILTSTAVPDETEPPTGDEATALHKFFDRPWFRRIWIVQEAGVSRNITVQCGAQEIDWWIFAFGYEIASRLKRSIRIGPKYHRNFTTMSALRSSLLLKNIHWESGLDPDIADKGVDVDDLALLSLLTKYRGYLATDPRDKVFALLGLTNSDLNKLQIRPDYAVPMRDVYIDVARALMDQADHLDLFAIPCNRTNPSSTLPSWVPDWADVQSQPYLLTDKRESQDPNDTLEGFREFTASRDTKSHTVIEEGGILHLSGYAMDSIAEIGGMMDVTDDALTFTTQDMGEDGTNKAYWGMLNAILEGVSKDADVVNDWAKLARTSDTSYKYPGTGENAFTAFARTLYTDTDKKTYLTDCKDWVDQFAILGPTLKQIPKFDLENLTVESIVEVGSKIKPFMSIFNSPAMQNVGKRSCVHTLYRRLARSQNGLLALVPANTMLNDHIALLQGGKTPYIVRQRQKSGYILVGETFVHGLMYGEGWEPEKCHTITFH